MGKVTSYAYDAQNRPTSLTLPGGSGTFFSYGYDKANHLTRITNGLGNPFGLGYDAENRLTSMTNELTKVWKLSLNANGWRTQLADPNSHTNPQDYESRLICSYVGGITITNTYDGLGRHVARKHSAIWTRYYYAGWQLIEERDRNGNVAADYVYGVGLDKPIRMARNGTNYYFHTDGLGSVTAVTDGNGNLIEQYSYDVYGMPTVYDGQTNVISASAVSNPWLFQGRYWEPDALLYNYRFRYYHPGMGRFMQADPIGAAGGINLYEFVQDNPVNWLDPLGLDLFGNLHFLFDFLTGHGPRCRSYGPDSLEVQEMRDSTGVKRLRQKFYGGGMQSFDNGVYGTGQAAWDTLVNPSTADWFSTAAQVGGFAGATVVSNYNGTVTFTIPNDAGANSFYYHTVGDRTATTGPLTTIHQTFTWSEPIPLANIPYSTGNRNRPPTLGSY